MATLEDKKEVNRPKFRDNLSRLIIGYTELKEEHELLLSRYDSLSKEVATYCEKIKELQDKYDKLLIAKTVEVSKGEVQRVSDKLSKLEQEIEYCITLLMK